MHITLTNPHTLTPTRYTAELVNTGDATREVMSIADQYIITGPRGAVRLLQVFTNGGARAIDTKGRSVDYRPEHVAI